MPCGFDERVCLFDRPIRKAIEGSQALTKGITVGAGEKIVLVLEAIGDDKIRVNSSSLDHPLVILADQALEIVAIGKKMGWSRRATGRRQSNSVSELKRRYNR